MPRGTRLAWRAQGSTRGWAITGITAGHPPGDIFQVACRQNALLCRAVAMELRPLCNEVRLWNDVCSPAQATISMAQEPPATSTVLK